MAKHKKAFKDQINKLYECDTELNSEIQIRMCELSTEHEHFAEVIAENSIYWKYAYNKHNKQQSHNHPL